MIFAYWDQLRGERAAPERGEIEPGEIRHVLADTFILEIGADRRAEFRLAGTRLCALFGRELKARPFVDLWPGHAQPGIRRHLTPHRLVGSMTPRHPAAFGASPSLRGDPWGPCSVQLDRRPAEGDEADHPVRDVEPQQAAALPPRQAARGQAVGREAGEG